MESLIANIAELGYPVLWAIVFLEAIGLPIPAALALLVAGGASARHVLDPLIAYGGALGVMMCADTLMFLMGRFTGWWLLGLLCRLSLNQDSCILRAADAFYRRGRLFLLFAKFVPGINTLAPPLAGSMNMGIASFLRFDLGGAAIYTGSYFGIGYLFSDVLGSITSGYQAFGRVISYVLGVLVVGYLAMAVWNWARASKELRVPMVDPTEAAHQLAANGGVVFDVRSHGYYDAKATRIQGSKRLEPNALNQVEPELAPNQPVYLYCTCLGEATSARVASELMKRGHSVAVIKGGLTNWRKRGLPVEAVPAGELSLLPRFI